jgi:LPXTG-motif cell wall-anchored protein
MTARHRILVALCATCTAFLALAYRSAAAGADYSDHGSPETSFPTASTHPSTYTPSGGLPRTGLDTGPLVLVAVVLLAGGIALVLASTKRRALR